MSESSRVPAVELAVRTDPGRDPEKQVNEDSNATLETKLGMLAVVCDGMGGHAGGREASELAIKTIVEIVSAAPPVTNPGVALKRAIEEANARIWTMPTAEQGFRPGSTVVAVLAHDAGAEIAHVGDSRIYLIHAGAISQITRDHSMVQEMVDRNIIRAEDAAKHPDANKILRALGIAKDVDVELRPQPLAFVNGDVFILCSDGLSDLVEPAEILDIAGSHPPKQAVGQLVDLANARGGHDNITAMVLRMKASATVNESTPRHVAKTVPLTAIAMPTTVDGNTGTLLSAPMPGGTQAQAAHHTGTQIQAPLMSGPPPSVPVHQDSMPTSGRGATSSRGPLVFLGVLLAVAALGILAFVAYTAAKAQRKPTNLVEAGVTPATAISAAIIVPDADAGPPAPTATQFVPAAPLATPTSTSVKSRSSDGGSSDPCAAYRRLLARGDGSADALTKLDQKCRASGGTP